jgi:hypothetical protein
VSTGVDEVVVSTGVDVVVVAVDVAELVGSVVVKLLVDPPVVDVEVVVVSAGIDVELVVSATAPDTVPTAPVAVVVVVSVVPVTERAEAVGARAKHPATIETRMAMRSPGQWLIRIAMWCRELNSLMPGDNCRGPNAPLHASTSSRFPEIAGSKQRFTGPRAYAAPNCV